MAHARWRYSSRTGHFELGVFLRASVRRHRRAPQPGGASDDQERPEASSRRPAMMDAINPTGELRHSIETRKQIHAWLSSGTRQRTKRLWKGTSEGDSRIDDRSGGSPLTIENGSDFPIGISLGIPGLMRPFPSSCPCPGCPAMCQVYLSPESQSLPIWP